MPLVSAPELVPQPAAWLAKGTTRSEDGKGYVANSPHWCLSSPPFRLEGGRLYTFSLAGVYPGGDDVVLLVESVDLDPAPGDHRRIYRTAAGPGRLSLAFRPARSGPYRLALRSASAEEAALLGTRDEASDRRGAAGKPTIGDLNLSVQTIGKGRISRAPMADLETSFATDDLNLPHWGPVRRYVHRRCRSSKGFNSLVAAIEMRLGREEVLSLPQYVALCPTGQCNATCDFCSVTINRTGIIKKQLPFDRLGAFLGPMGQTVHTYGIEGNGEPTLYAYFPELVEFLTRSSGAYLITNGSRLGPNDIPLLLALDSINFSLNAATAATHRRVMHLKEYEPVIAAIKRLATERGIAPDGRRRPEISVSFVVTADNIHEAPDFVRFAEEELGVDVIRVRPLSELGNDAGTVEDIREIVPFESDVADAIEGIELYLKQRRPRANVLIDPAAFRSMRPDPAGGVRMPLGCEDRLLAPRAPGWVAERGASIRWDASAVTIQLPGHGVGVGTEAIPVPPGRTLSLSFAAEVSGGAALLQVVSGEGHVIAGLELRPGSAAAHNLSLETGASREVRIVLSSRAGDGGVKLRLEFDRLRKPAPFVSGDIRLPEPRRWEVCDPRVRADLTVREFLISAPAEAGPYLVKSYGIPCLPHCTVELAIEAEVLRGEVGIGVLSGDEKHFLKTVVLSAGQPMRELIFDTREENQIRLVVSRNSAEDVEAKVRWLPPVTRAVSPDLELVSARHGDAAAGPSGPPPPGQLADRPASGAGLMPPRPPSPGNRSAPSLSAGRARKTGGVPSTPTPRDLRGSLPPPTTGMVRGLLRWLSGRQRYYCQKPWTDLNNFTVDGRLDVCCITTGESQQRYALGNLNRHHFQEVWNGPVAREFRRTVNTDPLPACRRCPMLYSYQGRWFNPNGAEQSIRQRLKRFFPGPLSPFGAWTSIALFRLVFRGFKTEAGWVGGSRAPTNSANADPAAPSQTG